MAVQLKINKAASGPHWPRLLKESGKVNWLKTDFSLWMDEEMEDEKSHPSPDFDPSQFGGDFSSLSIVCF